MRQKMYYGPMMVEMGDADAFIAGLAYNYPEVLRPALQCVGAQDGRWVSGVYMMLVQDRMFFFTDATVIIDPTAEQLAAIALNAADLAERFGVKPRIAMLSFSNFGSTPHPSQKKVQQATELVRQQRPDLEIDGEMQADVAVSPALMKQHYPFSRVSDANVLVFPTWPRPTPPTSCSASSAAPRRSAPSWSAWRNRSMCSPPAPRCATSSTSPRSP